MNNNYCRVSEQIAIHANEPDDRAISDILSEMCQNEQAYIEGELVELHRITDSIDIEEMREAVELSVMGNSLVIYNLYIKAIEDFING